MELSFISYCLTCFNTQVPIARQPHDFFLEFFSHASSYSLSISLLSPWAKKQAANPLASSKHSNRVSKASKAKQVKPKAKVKVTANLLLSPLSKHPPG